MADLSAGFNVTWLAPTVDGVVDALKMHAHEKDYLAERGLLALRDAVALHHRELQHLECTAADYDIAPDGRFAVVRNASADADIVVITNWFAKVRAKLGGR